MPASGGSDCTGSWSAPGHRSKKKTFEIEDEDLHLACYEIHGKQKTEQFTVGVANQFEEDEFQSAAWEILCTPAQEKCRVQPPS